MKIIHKIECSEQAKERKQSSMSRNTGNINMLREELNALVINEQERDEFGFQMFQNPYLQALYERSQREYKLKYNLKTAYDNQEFLRKMRADIKREYLTRKKQLKKLQTDAAVIFREDEMKLQEHYSTEFAKSQGMRVIDITLPLVHDISLPNDNVFDVRKFNIEEAFEGLRNLHREYYESEMQIAIEQAREKQERERQQQQQEQQDHREIPWAEWVAAGEASETCLGCNDLECSDCYDDDHDGNNDSDSYDSDYCGVFGYYPREYEYERQAREEEEARVAQAARLRAEHQAEAEAAEEAARRIREEEMSIEAEEAEEAEPTYDDDDIPSVEPKERHASNSAAVSATTNIISAKKKAALKSNAAAATKARIAKQHQKKSMKFVPLQITINDNRERHANNQDQEATAILSTSKLEINLPKKSLQGASREAIKRHNQKWNRDNALAKQSGARGTRIANLPDQMNCWAKCDGDDSDY